MLGRKIIQENHLKWITTGFTFFSAIGIICFLAVSTGTSQTREEVKTLVHVTQSEVQTMDPHDTMDYIRAHVGINLYDGLTRYRGNNPPVLEPWLAESWEERAHSKEWTFRLRKGVLFHDGTEMTAEDVVYSAKKLLHGGKGIAGTLSAFLKPDGIKAVDTYTVRFYLTEPNGAFAGLAQYISVQNKKVLQLHEEAGDYGNRWLATNGTRLGKDGVGTGAYYLKEWKPGSYFIYEKFPNYFKGWNQPHIKRVRLELSYELATRKIGLMQGKYHLWELSKSYVEMQEMMKSPLLQDLHFRNPKLNYIHLHVKKPPTSDLHFRKALSYAFDYDSLNETVFRGFVERAIGAIPPGMFGSLDPKKEFHYTRDLKKAREELAKCEIDYKKYEPLEIGTYAVTEIMAITEMMLSALRDLGIRATLVTTTWPIFTEKLSKPETTYHISPNGLSPYYLDPDHYSRLIDNRGFGTHMGGAWYDNPKVTSLLKKALSTGDRGERIRLYQEAQRIEIQDAAHIWINQLNYHNAVNKDIGGLENFCPWGGLQSYRDLYFKSEWGK